VNIVTESRAELLAPAQIESRLAEVSIVYVPLGALEFHGPHLPIGLDGLTAHAVCVEAARRSGGIVLPTIYQGTGGEHPLYPWTIMMRSGEELAGTLRATLDRLAALGVETTVILSGHFADEQRSMLRDLSQQWQQNGASAMRLVATTLADRDAPPIDPDHAGVFETLLLAAAHPELVHLDKLPALAAHPPVDPGDDPFGSHRHDPAHPLWGVFGPDPRQADLREATQLLASTAQWIAGVATAE
jgi:creatinine amidohydrolase